MDLTTLRKQPHLSASGISDYLECGLFYKFSRVDKLTPEFKTSALLFGSTIHAVLAQFYQGRSRSQKLTPSQLVEIFELHWHGLANDWAAIRYKPGNNFNTLLSYGKELLNTFAKELPEDEGSILGIEKTFSFNLDGLPVPIIGVCDLILEDPNGVITIVDHKTSSRSYSKNDIDSSLQLTIYHLNAKTNGMPQRDILLRLDCLIKTKKPKFEQYYTVRTPEDEQRVKRLILEVYKGISQGVFIPNINSWKCPSCEYQGACEAFLQVEK